MAPGRKGAFQPEESRVLEASAMGKYPVTSMDDRPVELAAEARARLEARARAMAVHFDVDVTDSAEILYPMLAALVVTEINPDHDPAGLLVRQFVDAFAGALRPVAANAARR